MIINWTIITWQNNNRFQVFEKNKKPFSNTHTFNFHKKINQPVIIMQFSNNNGTPQPIKKQMIATKTTCMHISNTPVSTHFFTFNIYNKYVHNITSSYTLNLGCSISTYDINAAICTVIASQLF